MIGGLPARIWSALVETSKESSKKQVALKATVAARRAGARGLEIRDDFPAIGGTQAPDDYSTSRIPDVSDAAVRHGDRCPSGVRTAPQVKHGNVRGILHDPIGTHRPPPVMQAKFLARNSHALAGVFGHITIGVGTMPA